MICARRKLTTQCKPLNVLMTNNLVGLGHEERPRTGLNLVNQQQWQLVLNMWVPPQQHTLLLQLHQDMPGANQHT